MQPLCRLGSLLLLLLALLPATSVRAQAPAEVARLKAALRQPLSSARTVDSLLTQARQLGSVSSQVVALGQLAAIRLQAQQPEQATPLLQEAAQLAGQLHDLHQAGWALGQVGAVQRRLARTNPDAIRYYDPLFRALDGAMRSSPPPEVPSAQQLAQLKDLAVPTPPAVSNYRHRRRSAAAADSAVASPVDLPAPGSPAFQRYLRTQLAPVDKWLDTLLAAKSNQPQVVQRLAASRQQRDRNQALSKAAAQQGDYAKAYQYFRQYTAYKDSLTAAATAQRLATLTYRQNLLQKETQIQRLTHERTLNAQVASRQRTLMWALAGWLVLLAGLAAVLIRNNRAKHRANAQLSQQKEAVQQALADLKTAQAQLIQAEKMASLGELTAGIAHEIQNPLNFVNNFSEVSAELLAELTEEQARPTRDPDLERELLADVQQNLHKISQHGQRASAIVRGMLAHARTSPGQKQPTDLNALADEYLQLAYHGTRAKDAGFEARLSTALDPALPPASVVPQEISRVLLNVLTNAFYAVGQRRQSAGPGYQPEVQLRTLREANQVKILIRDNGCGVPEALRQKVFNPFFTTKPTGQGTGLGLSLSYDIVTKGHGGTFTLTSEEGQFTEVTIALPIGG